MPRIAVAAVVVAAIALAGGPGAEAQQKERGGRARADLPLRQSSSEWRGVMKSMLPTDQIVDTSFIETPIRELGG